MKTSIRALAFLCVSALSAFAYAESVPVSARGHAFGTCDSITFDTCALMLKQQARRDAEQAMYSQCASRGGSLGGGYCHDSCNPLFVPPQPSPTPIFTDCTADCQANCELR